MLGARRGPLNLSCALMLMLYLAAALPRSGFVHGRKAVGRNPGRQRNGASPMKGDKLTR